MVITQLSESHFGCEFLYRDERLKKMYCSVEIEDRAFYIDGVNAHMNFRVDEQLWQVSLTLPHIYGEGANFADLKDALLKELVRLARWSIMNGSYHDGLGLGRGISKVILPLGCEWKDAAQPYRCAISKKSFEIVDPDLSKPIVGEQIRARRIILGELYAQSPMDISLLVSFHAWFPEDVIRSEIAGLRISEYARSINPEGQDDPRYLALTTKGREYFESLTTMQTNTVFIIAACDADERLHQKEVLETYKAAIRSVGLEPKFQEHEEPHKNIYVDIFDYIDACEFVIADITYQRASCYIEIGYALAKQKPVLLFVEEDYFNKEMNGKVPFDLFATKYQTYKYSDLSDLTKKCDERIKTIQSRHPL